MKHRGEIVAVCLSDTKGPKQKVDSGLLIRGFGFSSDVHAGTWHRQVSLLEQEKIDSVRKKGIELDPGAFGENLVSKSFDLNSLQIGQKIRIGERAVIQLTQRGKECHTRCIIFLQTGDCIMPTEGMFGRVLRGGIVQVGDEISVATDLEGIRFAIVTASDRASEGNRADISGKIIRERIGKDLNATFITSKILPDDQDTLKTELQNLCDEELCDLVLTTGGTGLSPRDVTPEATRSVIDREIPGIAEAIRAAGLSHTPRAMLSRAVCGQRGQSIILNLSGSPKAVTEQLDVVIPVLRHALETVQGIPLDCARH